KARENITVLPGLESVRSLKGALTGTVRDLASGVFRPAFRDALFAELSILPSALVGAAPWLLRARNDADLSLLRLVLDHAEADPEGLAIEMGDEQLSWRQLAETTSRI